MAHETNPAWHLFVYSLQAKSGFYIFLDGWKYQKHNEISQPMKIIWNSHFSVYK